MRVVGVDLGQHLGVALCDDGKITQAHLLEGPDATRRLCAWLPRVPGLRAIYWEPSLWLPGRKSAFAGVEQQRGAILAACGCECVSVAAQDARQALCGSRTASESDVLACVCRMGLEGLLPRHKRDTSKIATTRAAHVADAILLALYGHSRLAWAERVREAS